MHHAAALEILNPDLTAEVMNQVDAVIERYRGKPGALIPVLEETQDIIGYLPWEVQDYIGEDLNIPGSTIYGVVTFYSFFTMVPRGRHTIKVCMGTACYVKGNREVLARLRSQYSLGVGETTEDRRFSLEVVRCVGACGLAPVVMVDDDTHGGVTPDTVLKVLEHYD